uniref:heterogeneous nuclear ribonucleoprotein H2-like isoform X2 n=1 Tax=Ciona intestinalis TaxID=7719 RepID=UPI00089DC03C|nr:heterogeneous nuclear ribonucleoprotein H2-like isoform X2 [Ciona intestinalis]|eukprot:XP_018669390.1 heterogeneous nuclear ribonucleoprotein H2-like isoform X2 [Ciona intestinalis]
MTEERYVVRLRGLPWAATEAEVIKFLNVEVVGGEAGIRRTYTDDQRPSGEAFVEVTSQKSLQTCFEKDHQLIGKRYIEVFESSVKEMEYVLGLSEEEIGSSAQADVFVRLRGLPFQCSKEEVAQFFSGLEIVPNGITLPLDDNGRSTGEAYVEFGSPESAEKALTKHKEKIGHRYIEIFKSSKRELMESQGEYMDDERGFGSRGRPGPYDRPNRGGRGSRGQRWLRGGSRYAGGGGGGYGGGDYCEDDWEGNWRNNRGRGRGGMKPYGNRYNNSGGYGGNYGGGNYGGGNFQEDYGYNGDENYGEEFYEEEASPSQFVVRMRGLPFKCQEQDVFNFFSPLVPVRVNIEYSDDGRVTGEGTVFFASYQDAQAAMQKNKECIQHRYIELFLRSNRRDGGFRSGGQRRRGRGGGGGGGGYRF